MKIHVQFLRPLLYNYWRSHMSDLQAVKVRILLAEDNPGDVRLIREALKLHEVDFELDVVDDGEKALCYLDLPLAPAASGLDLILLDLNLPKMDGRDILKSIKACPQMEKVPVVVLSSSDSPHDRKEAAELGATRFVRKPSTLDEFMEIGVLAKELVSRK